MKSARNFTKFIKYAASVKGIRAKGPSEVLQPGEKHDAKHELCPPRWSDVTGSKPPGRLR